jgi:hypothetical protein
MTPFTIISSLILFGLAFLCFWLPNKRGHREIGLIVSIILGLLIAGTLIGNFDFLVIFIWPLILAFQIVFISYWVFRLFGRKNLATITAIILTTGFLLIIMQPWITDWTFNKGDAREILSWHHIYLQEDFEIIENESGGFTDYAHSFTLKISESDYQRIARNIRDTKSFSGLITDLTKQLPMADFKSTDTVSYETQSYLEKEYYTQSKMEDGTYHFIFQLSKEDRELMYLGINE